MAPSRTATSTHIHGNSHSRQPSPGSGEDSGSSGTRFPRASSISRRITAKARRSSGPAAGL